MSRAPAHEDGDGAPRLLSRLVEGVPARESGGGDAGQVKTFFVRGEGAVS